MVKNRKPKMIGLLCVLALTLSACQAGPVQSPEPIVPSVTLTEMPAASLPPSPDATSANPDAADYQFCENEDGSVTITKYTGSGGDIVIPAELEGKAVTAIGNRFEETGAFQDCTTLTSVVIPEGIVEIQDNAFYDCSNLKTVTVASSVIVLMNCAFEGCYNLQSIYFEGDAPDTGNYVFPTSYESEASMGLTVYYHEETGGWTNPWYGVQTATF